MGLVVLVFREEICYGAWVDLGCVREFRTRATAESEMNGSLRSSRKAGGCARLCAFA